MTDAGESTKTLEKKDTNHADCFEEPVNGRATRTCVVVLKKPASCAFGIGHSGVSCETLKQKLL